MPTIERRIALFLDFENLVTNTGITAATFDLQPAVDRLLEKGKVIFRRAYADWSRFKDAKGPLHELGVELIDVPPSTRAGKNAADMRLVIDALELCYARDYIDTFVIGSGDSDFCPLAYKLRENNRLVIGLGFKESTSRLFVKACDEFIYLKPRTTRRKTASEEAPPPPPARSGRRSKQQAQAESPKAAAQAAKAPVAEAPPAPEPKEEARAAEPAPSGRKSAREKKVPDIAREVVSSLLQRATGPINPSLIKETIVRKEHDFDEREHGFSTFSKMLEAMEKEGLLRRQQMKGRQWYVVAAEATNGAAEQEREAEAEGDEEGEEPGQREIPF